MFELESIHSRGGQHINAYFGLVVQAVSTKFVSFDKMVHLGNWSDQPHL